MAIETYDAIIKLPIGKKPCTVTIERRGDGTFDGTFSVLGATAPTTDGKIDDEGNFSCDCTITTIMGTMEATAEGRVRPDGLIEGDAKCRMGVMEMKSRELWGQGGGAVAQGRPRKGLFSRLMARIRGEAPSPTVADSGEGQGVFDGGAPSAPATPKGHYRHPEDQGQVAPDF